MKFSGIIHMYDSRFCELFEKQIFGARLEIISDVVSERHIAEKFMWYRKNRCGIGISDEVSEKTDVVSVFPMWHRNFSATSLFRYHIGNYF
jgi:hypothetical protein